MSKPGDATELPLRDFQVITELDASGLTARQRTAYLVHIDQLTYEMTEDYPDIHHYLIRKRGATIEVGLHYVQVPSSQVEDRQDRFVARLVQLAAQDLNLPVLQPGTVELTLV